MFLLTDSSIQKISGSNTGFYIMAWLPLAIIAIFAIRGMMQKKQQNKNEINNVEKTLK